MKKYKIQLLQDNIYQVFGLAVSWGMSGIYDFTNVLFQGTLPECEAWIRLTEEGYL